MRAAAVLVLVALGVPQSAHPWGWDVHRLVNRAATTHLPPDFQGFAQWADSLERFSTAADERKCCVPGERIKHFIDIDDYEAFFDGTLPHAYDAMVARYGQARVDGNGTVPWAIEAALGDLQRAFEARDWPRVVLVASDIGHYVADSHQPLHLTLNYDGQLTGQSGLHARYESAMTEIYMRRYAPRPGQASAYVYPLEAVFEWIEAIYPGVGLVLTADERATFAANGDRGSPDYYEVLWRETGTQTETWVRQASLATANMWLTAWRDAGAPALPGDPPAGEAPAAFVHLAPAEPTPFRATTRLRFEVGDPGPVLLRVFDARGRVVRTLLSADVGLGERNITWNGRDDGGDPVAAGTYHVRLERGGRAAGRKVVLVH